MTKKTYTAEQKRLLELWKEKRYDLWSKETLEIEVKACEEFIPEYREMGYTSEVERLELKVEYLQKIIKRKNNGETGD